MSANGRALPAGWAAAAQNQLEPGETVLAWLETDLNTRLFYAPGLVVLTCRRILSAAPPLAGKEPSWQAWPLTPGLDLRLREHGGTGALELVGPAGRMIGSSTAWT